MKLNLAILAAFVVNCALTFASQLLPGAVSNKVVSQKFQSLATPAGWAFSIWGIIFTSEACFAVAQLLPSLRAADEVVRAGPWFAAGCVLQGVWSVAFAYQSVYAAAALLALITLALWKTCCELANVARDKPPKTAHYLLLHLPFSLHFGWLTAASLLGVNVAVVAAAPHAHVALLALAVSSLVVILVAVMAHPSGKTDPAYAFACSWALTAISSQLRAPLADAPAADPILSWCPPLVTKALSIVALVLAGGAVVTTALSALLARRAALPTIAQPLMVGSK